MYDESIEVTNAEEVRSPTPESIDENIVHKEKQIHGSTAFSKKTARPLSSMARGDHATTSVPQHSTAELDSDLSDNTDDDDDDVQAALLEGYHPNSIFSTLTMNLNHVDSLLRTQFSTLPLELKKQIKELGPHQPKDFKHVVLLAHPVKMTARRHWSYDPREYEHLNVPSDVKDVFQYITCYTPQNIELEYKLRPFVPDFIPAVGDIDAFVKVARPDGKSDGVGLYVLDEPCANQSEPAVLCLQLRASTKQTSAKPVVVKKVENAEQNPKAIDRWIRDINELHKSKPAPTVQYARPMPDIDNLMQEWPPQFEERLNQIGLPTADLDCDLPTLVDIICSIFDIPRYESRVESLHVLFMLYSAIKNSQFQKPES